MFLLQAIENTKNNTQNNSLGKEIAQWVFENPIILLVSGVVVSVGFVWILTKVTKQIRTFGE
ncbi:hypothetical protein [Tenacibaculum finnmarkense]|uniref:hypothetical protein n=1 Tax=Tenacibaculum finnmarkense TaxID=2781243 RepID=UPI00187B67F2|nr:hypothetical protein [Tenacibaculum finnmarkense]MBE7659373.1 hypothetical protein [Tenacibaculum finnmarkense genomovar finnmarkense]MBE7692099.1 hypothetical protein [Tenacibaculum finnmarkense genomovar finnmarkense]MCD8453686.1 hypothetical protein [Tenacibaculum finnmarkense genomovar ulcerans]MCG8251064.1 hypothetical protein [Tenacibaculum finnmarkense genomovar finnmarkense]MCG8814675.1 hypothetical protein [Tenacibaculum finnmarkense]